MLLVQSLFLILSPCWPSCKNKHLVLVPMTLLFLFPLQVALNGFNSLDLPDLCYNPFLSLFVMYVTRENNVSICRGNIDLPITSVRFLDDYRIRFRGNACIIDIFACSSACQRGAA